MGNFINSKTREILKNFMVILHNKYDFFFVSIVSVTKMLKKRQKRLARKILYGIIGFGKI